MERNLERGRRIPIHDHSDADSGGLIHAPSVVTMVGLTPESTSSGGGTTTVPVASDVDITDAGGYYTGTEVETALQEVGADIATLEAAVLAASGHAHVTGETHLSDGSTTTYTLDEAFEPGSVEAWNTTTLAYLIVTETQPDQAAVSAAGSAGDKITFSYAASLA